MPRVEDIKGLAMPLDMHELFGGIEINEKMIHYARTEEPGGGINGANMEIFSGFLASQSLHQRWQKTHSKQQAVQSKTFANSLINVCCALAMLVTNIKEVQGTDFGAFIESQPSRFRSL